VATSHNAPLDSYILKVCALVAAQLVGGIGTYQHDGLSFCVELHPLAEQGIGYAEDVDAIALLDLRAENNDVAVIYALARHAVAGDGYDRKAFEAVVAYEVAGYVNVLDFSVILHVAALPRGGPQVEKAGKAEAEAIEPVGRIETAPNRSTSGPGS